ncbi:MAG: hypothetical protein U5K43_07290 [Halofilum sp. (in: g-proteobacteria)]|nr:hypothetical protein [Halofilum sp. (in: g-proteobacteria)]
MELTYLTDYSLRVLMYAGTHDDRLVTLREIAGAYDICAQSPAQGRLPAGRTGLPAHGARARRYAARLRARGHPAGGDRRRPRALDGARRHPASASRAHRAAHPAALEDALE